MYVLNITDDYNKFTNRTDNANEDISRSINYLFLSIPSSILLLVVLV